MPAQEEQDQELLELIQKTCGNDGYSYDDDVAIPTSFDLDDEKWQENFFQDLGPSRSKQPCSGEDQEEDEEDNDVEFADCPQSSAQGRTTSIKTYSDALIAIEDLSLFLRGKGHATEANEVFKPSYESLLQATLQFKTNNSECLNQ